MTTEPVGTTTPDLTYCRHCGDAVKLLGTYTGAYGSGIRYVQHYHRGSLCPSRYAETDQ